MPRDMYTPAIRNAFHAFTMGVVLIACVTISATAGAQTVCGRGQMHVSGTGFGADWSITIAHDAIKLDNSAGADGLWTITHTDLSTSAGFVWSRDFNDGTADFEVIGTQIQGVGEDSGKIAGTIQGDTVAMEIVKVLEDPSFVFTPGFEPGQIVLTGKAKFPQKVTLSITRPAQDSRFVYNNSDPGRVMIQAEATVTPAEYVGRIAWSADPVDGRAPTFDPSDARGAQISITYEGLPRENGQFGPKNILARLDADCGTVEAHTSARLFFPRDATNNPGFPIRTPNWFYYWSQITSLTNMGNRRYGGTGCTTSSGQMRMGVYTLWNNYYSICDIPHSVAGGNAMRYTKLVWKNRKVVRRINTTGIDTFALVSLHENAHMYWANQFWPPEIRAGDVLEAVRQDIDLDQDGVPDRRVEDLSELPLVGLPQPRRDEVRAQLRAAHQARAGADDIPVGEPDLDLDPHNPHTGNIDPSDLGDIGSEFSLVPDIEIPSLKAAEGWMICGADAEDWAKPGKQWGDETSPDRCD